ncbi:hypothetical protein ACQR1H_09145 [Bradyrhizobium sp. HKCCYLRH2015]|uniref:hypothetical protein n=1 Tax=Bradyrhizobium sp. HKCCYLRH2015 TaxID=3420742 RepID=UPI003EBACE9A
MPSTLRLGRNDIVAAQAKQLAFEAQWRAAWLVVVHHVEAGCSNARELFPVMH